MITKRKIIDLIQLVQNNSIQVREAILIEEEGVELSRTFHRYVLSPGDNIENEDPRIQSIANAIWTPEIIENYRNFLLQKQLHAENLNILQNSGSIN
jgi:hypothetical protein